MACIWDIIASDLLGFCGYGLHLRGQGRAGENATRTEKGKPEPDLLCVVCVGNTGDLALPEVTAIASLKV